jgi:hypothetical protein
VLILHESIPGIKKPFAFMDSAFYPFYLGLWGANGFERKNSLLIGPREKLFTLKRRNKYCQQQ